MGGVLTHTIAALICLAIVHRLHFKWEYSYSVFAGNFLPDVIKFGFSALRQGTLAIFNVEHDTFYQLLNTLTSSPANWILLGLCIAGITLSLYHHHYIKNKTMKEYDELFLFLFLGVMIHLVIDVNILETSSWI